MLMSTTTTDEQKTTASAVPQDDRIRSCLLCEEYDSGNKKTEYTCQIATNHPVTTSQSQHKNKTKKEATSTTLVLVEHTSLTYADALVVLGRSGGAKEYPIIPGTDFAGVCMTDSDLFHVGDRVVASGGELGRSLDGGFATVCHCPLSTLTLLPSNISTKRAAQMGSAAVTAMSAVMEIELFHRQIKGKREVLVSGATGSVGGYAVAILSNLGYSVTALTRDAESNRALLAAIGAHKAISCNEYLQACEGDHALASPTYIGIVDTLGRGYLSKFLPYLHRGGIAVTCGCLAGDTVCLSMIPFIRRGVRLCGIDSRYLTDEERILVWERLSRDVPESLYEIDGWSLFSEVKFSQVQAIASKKLMGGPTGIAVTVDIQQE